MKTAAEKFASAVAALKELQADGYECGPVNRLSLSATGRVKEEPPAPKASPKAGLSFAKAKTEEGNA